MAEIEKAREPTRDPRPPVDRRNIEEVEAETMREEICDPRPESLPAESRNQEATLSE